MEREPHTLDRCPHCGLTWLDAKRAEELMTHVGRVTIIRHGQCEHILAWKSGGKGPFQQSDPSYIVDEGNKEVS